MSFPKNSSFDREDEPLIEMFRVRPAKTDESHLTKVATSDIEQLEYDLRNLSYDAGSPEEARLFDELANRVASFYKG